MKTKGLSPSMLEVVILGNGITGFDAAFRSHDEGITPVMYEQSNFLGGNAASFRYSSGFLFDVSPHILFTKDPHIQGLFAENVDQKYVTVPIQSNNPPGGVFEPRHPAQLHLREMVEDVIVPVIADFVAERRAPNVSSRNTPIGCLRALAGPLRSFSPCNTHESTISPALIT
jgi:uncharacterized protein with NAD-binding domain and iron-sulfur cluster